jgi:hypothetical protein
VRIENFTGYYGLVNSGNTIIIEGTHEVNISDILGREEDNFDLQ